MAGLVMLLEAVKGVGVTHAQADVIESIQQTVLAERIDLERGVEAMLMRYRLLLKVDGDGVAGIRGRAGKQRLHIFV